MNDYETYFITWTTYGTWLPGDARGWRKRREGYVVSQPLLERWCLEQMKGEVVLLARHDRETVEQACHEHCEFRKWELLAVSARSNHVHAVVIANENPQKGHSGLTARAPWIVAFTFGLLHGFGFAGALSDVGLPQTSIPMALLTFNLGVEAGQLMFVAAVVIIYSIVRRIKFTTPEWAYRLPAYVIGGVAVFWTIERIQGFF